MVGKTCYKTMIDLKFSEIIKLNNEYKYSLHDQFNIGIISNISIQQIKPIIEYSLRYGNINAICNIGEYDNILQDTIKFVKHNLIIYFWESCNFTNGFHYEVNLMNDTQVKEFIKVNS